MSEREARDAPSWYSAEEAGAWASGWNEARRSALLEAAAIVEDMSRTSCYGTDPRDGSATPLVASRHVAAAIRALADGEEKKG